MSDGPTAQDRARAARIVRGCTHIVLADPIPPDPEVQGACAECIAAALTAVAAEVRAEEAEACAQLADLMTMTWGSNIAAAIRQRAASRGAAPPPEARQP